GVQLSFNKTALLAVAASAALVGPVAAGAVEARETGSRPVAAVEQRIVIEERGSAAPQARVQLSPKNVEARPVSPQTGQTPAIRGTWEIENPAVVGPNRIFSPDRVQLTFDGRTGTSLVFNPSLFR